MTRRRDLLARVEALEAAVAELRKRAEKPAPRQATGKTTTK